MNPTAPVTPAMQNGGWYNGQQYWNGQLGTAGVINNPNQPGFGQPVSSEVNKQSDVAQGLKPGTIDAFVAGKSAAGGGATGGAGANGMAGTNATYDSLVANNPELKAVNDEIAAKTAAHETAIKNINDNPFYSAGRMTGKQAAIDNVFRADMANLTAKKTGIEKSVQDRYNASTAANPNLKVIQSGDTLMGIDMRNGNVLYKTNVPGMGGTGGSGTGTKNLENQFNADSTSLQWIPAGANGKPVGVLPQLIAKYAKNFTLQQIIKMAAASPLGQKYGGVPIESAAELQYYYDKAKSAQ